MRKALAIAHWLRRLSYGPHGLLPIDAKRCIAVVHERHDIVGNRSITASLGFVLVFVFRLDVVPENLDIVMGICAGLLV